MKIKNVLIDLHTGYANEPTFIIIVDELPTINDVLYAERNALYFGYNKEGFVSFFSYNQNNQKGYGGHEFALTMQDLSTKILKGPWSSRAGVMNKAGFPECLDVVFRDWGGNETHGALLVSELAKHTSLYKSKESRDGEYTFVPKL